MRASARVPCKVCAQLQPVAFAQSPTILYTTERCRCEEGVRAKLHRQNY